MALTLHYHPLASFCWKVQIGLHESGLPFEPVIVDLGDPDSRRAFLAVWPMGKMPALVDGADGTVVAETSIILEYLAQRFQAARWLLPSNADLAREARFRDRIFDLYVQLPMQRIVADRLRPAASRDPLGVESARAELKAGCDLVEQRFAEGPWGLGEAFSIVDCAAAPALYYADKVAPLGAAHPRCLAYLERLKARPSFARVLQEAEPYFQFFPAEP